MSSEIEWVENEKLFVKSVSYSGIKPFLSDHQISAESFVETLLTQQNLVVTIDAVLGTVVSIANAESEV